MAVADGSKNAVKDRLAELEDEYTDVPLHQATWEVPPDQYDRAIDAVEAGQEAVATVVVTNDDGEQLLVRYTGDEIWTDPSCTVGADESLDAAAVRAVRTITGIQCSIEGVHRARIVGIVDESNTSVDPVYRLTVRFEGKHENGTPQPDVSRIDAVRWWNERPDEATEMPFR